MANDGFSRALRIIGRVMARGRATHRGRDWRDSPAAFHLDRARRHLDLLARGDTSEPHLAHATCRLLIALELSVDGTVRARVSLPQ